MKTVSFSIDTLTRQTTVSGELDHVYAELGKMHTLGIFDRDAFIAEHGKEKYHQLAKQEAERRVSLLRNAPAFLDFDHTDMKYDYLGVFNYNRTNTPIPQDGSLLEGSIFYRGLKHQDFKFRDFSEVKRKLKLKGSLDGYTIEVKVEGFQKPARFILM